MVGVMLLGAAGSASAGSLPSGIERCLGLRPNQDLPAVIERARPNQPLPSAVERDIMRQCRYGNRHDPYSRYGWDRRPRARDRYHYESY